MKKILTFLGVLSLLAIPAQGSFAWTVQDLNPLPYVGIGPNYTRFSLNPFKGFRNCEPCKRVEKSNKCAQAEPMRCPTCQKAFVEEIPDCGCNIRNLIQNIEQDRHNVGLVCIICVRILI